MGGTVNALLTSQEIRKLTAGDTFKGIFVVSNLLRKGDKNGKYYWEIAVSDAQGTLDAKVWGDAGWLDRSNAELETKPEPLSMESIISLKGKTLGVTGKVSDYRGQNQYSFSALSLLNQEKFPPAKYVAHSPISQDVLVARYESLLAACAGQIGDFVRFVYSGERWKTFRDWPAAVSHHHAYANGLLEHSVSVAQLAKSMADVYSDPDTTLDVSIVIAGALLHDLGKLESYSMQPIPDITLDGAVHDHVAIGYARLIQLAAEFGLDAQTTTHLGHILLSHHGQKEFGSPVLPATPEAIIVSYADGLDFHLFCWKDAVKDMLPGQQMSLFHYGAQRRFWNRPETDGEEE